MNKVGKEIEQLKGAIATLEAQRQALGDEVVDAALGPMQEKLAALNNTGDIEQQRKQVTLLFMDIAGHTQLIRDLDPEENMEIIDRALARLAKPIAEHGGHIARYQGDGFKAVFGLPSAQEDDPERAVQAGLRILEVVGEIASELESERSMSGFRVRVGIDTGLVVSGGLTEGEDTIKGTSVNLAARLESAAQPGSLLISHNTYRHIRGVFDVLPLDPIQVKGFDQPVQVYRVLRAKPRAFRMPTRGIEGLETHMIGRQAELQQLQEIYAVALEEAETQVVTIVGDPGIGKSRLLYEFEQWVELRPEFVRIFRGRAMPHSSSTPFGLLRSLFAFRFNILESDSIDMVRQKLETGLGEYLEVEPQMKSHFIGALLGYDFQHSPYLAGIGEDSKQLHSQALFYLGQFIELLAQNNLVLVLLEDIHWADNASLDALQQIAREHLQLRLMVVCLARPVLFDQRPYWGQGETYHTRLDLKPLTQRTCRQLVREVLKKVQDLPEALQELIVANAEGNPFYIEELVKILIEDGVVSKDEIQDTWRVDPNRLPDLHVPPTLVAVLQARLDGLPEAERTVLQQASVVGRIFWDAVLRVLEEAEQPPMPALIGLARRELIYHREGTAFDGTEEYIIKHALLRDVVYESVLKRARLKYHQKIAAWLVEASQANRRIDEYAALIAGHYDLGGETQTAAEWYVRAGERARNQNALQESSSLFQRALHLLPAQPDELRWQALKGISGIYNVTKVVDERRKVLNELMELARESGNKDWLAHANDRMGFFFHNLGDNQSAAQFFDTALSLAREIGDYDLTIDLLAISSLVLIRLGETQAAADQAEEAIAGIEKVEDQEIIARVYLNTSSIFHDLGDYARTAQLINKSISIIQKLDNRFAESVALSNLGYNYNFLGKLDEARPILERSVILAGSIGAGEAACYTGLNLALTLWRAGEIEAARQQLQKSIPALIRSQDEFGEAAGYSYLGLVLEQAGEIEEAFKFYQKSRTTLEKIGSPYAKDALAGLARCGLGLGQLNVAQSLATELWDYLVEHGSPGMEFPMLAYLTCVQVFEATSSNTLSREALQAGYKSLIDNAEKISDEEYRRSYRENIPENAEIITRWKARQTGI